MFSNLYGSSPVLPPCNYLPASISPDFNFLKPSILPDFNHLFYPPTTSATTSLEASYLQFQTIITNELIEAERRKLTELEQQLVTRLLQASIHQKQESPSPVRPTLSVITKKPHARPHQCSTCGKRFRFHSNLVEHRTVHFDGSEHYYSCPFCPKKCRLKGNLKKHLHRHFKTQFEVDEAWHSLYGGRSKHPSESSSSSSTFSSSNKA